MSENANIPVIKRFRFFDGQQLTAEDLSDWWQAQRNLRWLHNRSSHMWGIADGLAATGEAGDSEVTISPGLATDCLGREIVLTAMQTLTVPAVAGGPGGQEASYYLVASYRPDSEQQVLERRPGVCVPEGTVRLSEAPRLDWKQPNQLTEGLELVLAQAWIKNCQLSRPLALAARRNARPSRQPYIATGQTPVGETAWVEWGVEGQTIGVYTEVDISTARFQTTPQIMARVSGDRHFIDDQGQLEVITGQAGVVAVTPHSFTLQMRTEASITDDELLNFVTEVWHVIWVGIEAGGSA